MTLSGIIASMVWYFPGLLAVLRLSRHDKLVEILDITLARWPVHDSHANTYNVWLYFSLFLPGRLYFVSASLYLQFLVFFFKETVVMDIKNEYLHHK